ncbi:Alcohol dehydrogenase 2 [compost metagenome]
MTNATLMPYVLKFNRPAIEERITRLAAYLHLPSPGFDSFLAFVLKLRKDIAVPHTLFELGVDDQRADLIADMAIVDPSAGGNPLPLTKAGVTEIFQAAFHGRL